MHRPWSTLFLLVPALLGSCALPIDAPSPATPSASGTDKPELALPIDATPDTTADTTEDQIEIESTPEREPTVPSETFASLDALCREQKHLVRPLLRAAEQEAAARGEPTKIAPRCEVSATALAKVPVELRAPFLEVRAIQIETGSATETHLATRTAAGWRAVLAASVTSYHDDPGCFSIERDGGILSVRVEGSVVPALVIVESSDRGVVMEDAVTDDAGNEHMITWEDVKQRARACRTEASGYLACDASVVIRTERIPSSTEGGRHAQVRFATEATVDARGHVRAAALPPQDD